MNLATEMNLATGTADGKLFAVVLYQNGATEQKPIDGVTVLLNFFDELRRRMPAGGQ